MREARPPVTMRLPRSCNEYGTPEISEYREGFCECAANASATLSSNRHYGKANHSTADFDSGGGDRRSADAARGIRGIAGGGKVRIRGCLGHSAAAFRRPGRSVRIGERRSRVWQRRSGDVEIASSREGSFRREGESGVCVGNRTVLNCKIVRRCFRRTGWSRRRGTGTARPRVASAGHAGRD